jgi:hypothetical protein
MNTMIKTHIADMWLREEDLAADIPGRPDHPSDINACIKYLRRGTWALRTVNAPGVDEKARNALVHARVQGAFAQSPMIAQLREQLIESDTTIARLLAFVPPKAQALSDSRMHEIVREVGRVATELFQGHKIVLTLTEENDSESLACHRLTVSVQTDEDDDITPLVNAEMKLREHLVSFMADKELRAIRVLVEYETLSSA